MTQSTLSDFPLKKTRQYFNGEHELKIYLEDKMKYRKKPIVIEAEQWFPGKEIDGVDGSGAAQYIHGLKGDQGWIETLEGGHVVSPGDWIIIGIAGEKYPCKPDIFDATYELVE